MSLQIYGHKVEITDALKEHIEAAFTNVRSHFEKINNVHVSLTIEKNIHKAEIDLRVPGKSLCAKSESADMYHSINDAFQKVDHQIIKVKQKWKTKDHHKMGRMSHYSKSERYKKFYTEEYLEN